MARLRKRATGSEAIAQAMAQADAAAYTTSAAIYAELRGQLQLESLAALSVLMEVGAAEAVILSSNFGGQHAVRSVVGLKASSERPAETEEIGEETIGDHFAKAIVPALKTAIADPGSIRDSAVRKLLLEAVAATRKVSRVGFRRENRTDREMIAALQSGATVVLEVIRELDRLTTVLTQKAALADVARDEVRFHAAFRRFYLSAKEG